MTLIKLADFYMETSNLCTLRQGNPNVHIDMCGGKEISISGPMNVDDVAASIMLAAGNDNGADAAILRRLLSEANKELDMVRGRESETIQFVTDSFKKRVSELEDRIMLLEAENAALRSQR